MMNKVVCLCGSTKFKEQYIEQNRVETLKGNIVLSVGLFGHHENLDMASNTKRMLDILHLQKIALCNEVLVINVGGYIGSSTRKEIEFAKTIGKTVKFLENTNNTTKFKTKLYKWLLKDDDGTYTETKYYYKSRRDLSEGGLEGVTPVKCLEYTEIEV